MRQSHRDMKNLIFEYICDIPRCIVLCFMKIHEPFCDKKLKVNNFNSKYIKNYSQDESTPESNKKKVLTRCDGKGKKKKDGVDMVINMMKLYF